MDMKTFDQLDTQQKEDAIGMAFYDLLNLVRDGVLELQLVNPASQQRLELILSKARKTETPRLAVLQLLHDKPIRQEIERLALVAAHGSEYNDSGDPVKEIDRETAKRVAEQS